jgi:hypothetical protein
MCKRRFLETRNAAWACGLVGAAALMLTWVVRAPVLIAAPQRFDGVSRRFAILYSSDGNALGMGETTAVPQERPSYHPSRPISSAAVSRLPLSIHADTDTENPMTKINSSDPACILDSNATGTHWFVTAVCNPQGYTSRNRHYYNFRRHIIDDLGGRLLTVELAYGSAPFVVTARNESLPLMPGRERVLQVRAETHPWAKEHLWNLGLFHLQTQEPLCAYATFADAEVDWTEPQVESRIIEALRVYPLVHPYRVFHDLGPDDAAVMIAPESFGYQYRLHSGGGSPHGLVAFGYAVSVRTCDWIAIGGFYDRALVGGGNEHMWKAMAARPDWDSRLGLVYYRPLQRWIDRAQRRIGIGNFGYVNATLRHHFHGFRSKRGYSSRRGIVSKTRVDPITDLRVNADGMYELSGPRGAAAEALLLRYYASRDEDAAEGGPNASTESQIDP